MIKAIWFMVKVGVLVALALWVVENPGFVEMAWLDYKLRIHVGVFLIALVAIILLSIFLYRAIRTFVDFPKSFRRYQEVKRQDKGYRALTLGLTAVAAGDTKAAVYQAHRAAKLLGDDSGLALLLHAQAARLDGREEDAQESFVALLENDDAAFLGVRGLLQTALDAQDYPGALDLGRRALKIHPKQPWILKIVYDLEIRARDWEEARKTLYRAEKAGAVPGEKVSADRVAMLLAEAENFLDKDARTEALKKAKKAYQIDPNFVPAIAQLARLYNQTGKRRKAMAVIEKAWKTAPHPEFVKIWDALAASSRSKKPPGRRQWFEKLLEINPSAADGQLAAGEIALEEGLWGEARTHFKRAEELEPCAKLYRLFAELEERSSQNEEAAIMWLEKAAEAPPGKIWVCRETGHVYEQWHPIAQPHGAFNTIEWADPHGVAGADMLIGHGGMAGGLLEAPQQL